MTSDTPPRRRGPSASRPLPTPAALDVEQAAHYVALSPRGLRALVQSGHAPRPVLLSPGRVAWLRAELDAWLDSRPVSELLPPGRADVA